MLLRSEYSLPGKQRQLQHHIAAILTAALEIISRTDGVQWPLTASDKTSLYAVREFIDQLPFDEYPGNDVLARRARLNAWKLSYGFKQLFGTTPEDYFLVRRFDEAKARLLRGDTVIDVALFLGYSTSSNFITEFRKRFGDAASVADETVAETPIMTSIIKKSYLIFYLSMKFSILLIILLLAIAHLANAQLPNNHRWRFGAGFGLTLAHYRFGDAQQLNLRSDSIKPQPLKGIRIGLDCSFRLSEHFTLQSGVHFSERGQVLSRRTSSNFTNINHQTTEGVGYLEIPLLAVYRAGSFFVGAGPYLGLALAGQRTIATFEQPPGGNSEVTSKIREKMQFHPGDPSQRRTDIGLTLETGYHFTTFLYSSIGFIWGARNLRFHSTTPNSDDFSVLHRNVSFSVGTYF